MTQIENQTHPKIAIRERERGAYEMRVPGPRRAAQREKIGSSSREGTWASSSSTEGEAKEMGVERKRWGSSGWEGEDRVLRKRWGSIFFPPVFHPKIWGKLFSLIFHNFSWDFLLYFFSFFFLHSKQGKKIDFLIFFFPPDFLRTKHTLRVLFKKDLAAG